MRPEATLFRSRTDPSHGVELGKARQNTGPSREACPVTAPPSAPLRLKRGHHMATRFLAQKNEEADHRRRVREMTRAMLEDPQLSRTLQQQREKLQREMDPSILPVVGHIHIPESTTSECIGCASCGAGRRQRRTVYIAAA